MSKVICLTHANQKYLDHQTFSKRKESCRSRQELRGCWSIRGYSRRVRFPFLTCGAKIGVLISRKCSYRVHFSFSLLGIGGSFLFRLPIVRRLPFPISIYLDVVVKLLFLLVIGSISRSTFVLLMDDLTRAVSQFCPALGGMSGGFPPGPSGDSSFPPILASEERNEHPGTSEGQARAPRDRLNELREDRSLDLP